MVKLSSLLEKRFKKTHSEKIEAMSQQSSEGSLSSFAGLFQNRPLEREALDKLQTLLTNYGSESTCTKDYEQDFLTLSSISSEIKVIHHQSIILHGERIKKAGDILKKYKDGAFSAWLLLIYGNRQTPYNFLVYYEFYCKLPNQLKPIVEKMPRQAIYVLASRRGDDFKKQEIINNYRGETKNTVLATIRETFPLEKTDRRQKIAMASVLSLLEKAYAILEQSHSQSKICPQKIFKLQSLLKKFETIKNKITEN